MTIKINPKFILDKRGEKESVLLSIKDFDKMLDVIDEFEDTKAAIKAKGRKNPKYYDWEEVKKELYA